MQKDPNRFKECLEKALPLWDFYFYYVSKNYNFDNVFERKAASEFLLTIINKINDKVIQSKYIKKFAEVFEVKEDVVVSQLATVPSEVKFVSKPTYEERQQAKNSPQKPLKSTIKASKLELYLIYLLFQADAKSAKLMDSLIKEEHFESEEPKKLLDVYRKEFSETTAKNIDIKAFHAKIMAYDKNLADMFEETYLADISASFATNDALLKEFKATLNRIKMSFHRAHIKDLTFKLKKYEASNEIDKQRECQLEINKHKEEIRLLESSV
jgi:DNA primase